MTLNLYRLLGGKPLLARVVVVADEFFLLGIYGNGPDCLLSVKHRAQGGGRWVPKSWASAVKQLERSIAPFLRLLRLLETYDDVQPTSET